MIEITSSKLDFTQNFYTRLTPRDNCLSEVEKDETKK